MIAGSFLHGSRLLRFLDLLRLDHLPKFALIDEVIADLLGILNGVKEYLGRILDRLCPALDVCLMQIQVALHLLLGQRNTELLGGHRRCDFRTQLLDGIFLPCVAKAPPQPAGRSRGMAGFVQEAAHIAVSIPEVALRRHNDLVLRRGVMAVSTVTVKPDRHILDKGIPVLADQPDIRRWRHPFQLRHSLDLGRVENMEITIIIPEISLFCLSVPDFLCRLTEIHDLLCADIDCTPELHRHTLGALLDTPALFLGLVKGTPTGILIAKGCCHHRQQKSIDPAIGLFAAGGCSTQHTRAASAHPGIL